MTNCFKANIHNNHVFDSADGIIKFEYPRSVSIRLFYSAPWKPRFQKVRSSVWNALSVNYFEKMWSKIYYCRWFFETLKRNHCMTSSKVLYIYPHTWLKITYIHANTYMYIHAYIYIIYLLYICMETHMWVKPCMSMCILWTQKLDRLDTNCYAVLFQDFLVMILKILYNLTKLQLP